MRQFRGFATVAVAIWSAMVVSPVFGQSNVNDAFIASESGVTGTPTFAGPGGGTISVGYYATPGSPSSFSTANLTQTNSFNGNANIEGEFIANNIIVPAILVNTAATPLALNFGGTILGNQILLHPGNTGADGFALPASEAVLRYTVGAGGTYTITGAFSDIGGGPVAVDVLVNGVSILTAGAGSDTLAFNETEALNAGDLLDFVVDDANGIGSDSTGLFANIAPVPEPATLGTLGLAAAGLLARRRRVCK